MFFLVSGLDGLNDPEQDPARKALNIRADTARFQEAIAATERCPYPVIAAIHGVAYGLAIDIITACDIRYAAENARFSIKVRCGETCAYTKYLTLTCYYRRST